MTAADSSDPLPLRSGRRRRIAIVLGVLFVLYSAAGFLVAPYVVRSQVEKLVPEILGLDVAVESVRVNPYALSVTMRGVEVDDRFGGRLLATDALYVNAEARSLFRWALVVREIRIERPYIGLRRQDDGELNFLEPAEKGIEAAREIETIPRLVVDRFVLEGGEVDVEDRVPAAPLETSLGPIALELRDISTLPDDEGDHVLAAAFREGGTVRWNGDFRVNPPRARGTISVEGLGIVMLWRYVDHLFAFEVRDGTVAARIGYEARFDDDGPAVEVDGASFELRDLSVTPQEDETEVLHVDRAAVSGAAMRWPASEVAVDRIEVAGALVSAWLREDGTLNWLDFLQIEIDEADRAMLGPGSNAPPDVPAPAAAAADDDAGGPAWRATLGALEIAEAAVRFEDRTVEPAHAVAVEDVGIAIREFDSAPGARFGLSVDARIGESGRASVSGDVGVLPSVVADLTLRVDGVDLALARPYAGRFARVDLAGGSVRVEGAVGFEQDADAVRGRFEGDVALGDVRVLDQDGGDLVSWSTLAVAGIRTRGLPPDLRVAVRSVEIDSPRARVVLDENRELNLTRALSAADADPTDGTADASSSPAPEAAGSAPFPIEIGAVRVRDAEASIENLSLPRPWAARLHQGSATVTGISSSGTVAEFSVEGRLDETAVLRASGTIDPFDPGREARVAAEGRGIDLAGMSPYGEALLGHRIDAGTLETSLQAELNDDLLEGSDHVEITGLTLGEKVEVEGALDLPVGLAVGLLKDRNGRITLDVPLAGNLSEPGFRMSSVVRQAMGKVLGNLVKSPFRILGGLVGADGDDLQAIGFAPGSAEVEPSERSKLAKIGKALGERPKLVLEVSGPWDGTLDPPALRTERVEARIAARREGGTEPDGSPTEVPVSREAAVEALYAGRFGAEAHGALRAAHTAAPAVEGEAPTFDDAEFYRAAERALVEAEDVGPDDLRELAERRAASILAALGEAGLPAGDRVRRAEPTEVERTDGVSRVDCVLELAPAR